MAAALDAIHEQGIVHRDVKPPNVLLGSEGAIKLADLGVADVADRTRITTSGAVVGSYSYMAPEQLEEAPPSPAMDVYAFAALAYELLSGEKARPESNPLALAYAIATQPPPGPEKGPARNARPGSTRTGSGTSGPPASGSASAIGQASTPAAAPSPAGGGAPGPGGAGAGTRGSGARSPSAAVQSFHEDAAAHQFGAAWALADPNMRNQLGGYSAFQDQMSSVRSITFHRIQVTNSGPSSATVALHTTSVQTGRTQRCEGTPEFSAAAGPGCSTESRSTAPRLISARDRTVGADALHLHRSGSERPALARNGHRPLDGARRGRVQQRHDRAPLRP